MKKKLIFAVAIGFFAVATVFNLNLIQSNNADDVSLDAIAIMAQAGAEFTAGGRFWTTERQMINGTPFTSRWTPRQEYCSGTTSSTTTTRSRTSNSSIAVVIPGTPIEISSSSSSTITNTHTINYAEPIISERVVCVTGDGNCLFNMDCTRS